RARPKCWSRAATGRRTESLAAGKCSRAAARSSRSRSSTCARRARSSSGSGKAELEENRAGRRRVGVGPALDAPERAVQRRRFVPLRQRIQQGAPGALLERRGNDDLRQRPPQLVAPEGLAYVQPLHLAARRV